MRRELARRLRRRRFRVRGGALSLAAVSLCVVVAGAGVAIGAGKTVTSLKRGDRGAAVAQVQRELRIPADGVFGPQTERAVRRFQRRRGLVVDGVVGPQTRQALGLPAFSASSVQRGSRSVSGGGSSVRIPPILRQIAECESGGDPTAVSADGRYFGKYQFSRATWRRMGGRGNPARAPESEQDQRAAMLYEQEGTRPWPVCGRGL
jgi:Transglycosylase-like domain/Putative peptidoglycan binding domain